jgi:hypothetical protein
MTGAGWTVHEARAGGGAAARGVLVGTRPASNADRAAAALISSLQSMGIVAAAWPFEQLVAPTILFSSNVNFDAPIRVYIGSKP